jgi:hypothetical protein
MRMIYEKASRVTVWLSEAGEDSDFGMNVVGGVATSDGDKFKKRAMKMLSDGKELRAGEALLARS